MRLCVKECINMLKKKFTLENTKVTLLWVEKTEVEQEEMRKQILSNIEKIAYRAFRAEAINKALDTGKIA